MLAALENLVLELLSEKKEDCKSRITDRTDRAVSIYPTSLQGPEKWELR
jgi:hypothetical protein